MTAEPYVPQVGHRVRRTHVVEGVVEPRTDADWVCIDGTDWLIGQQDTTTWERLPDPEPDKRWKAYDGTQAGCFTCLVVVQGLPIEAMGQWLRAHRCDPLTYLMPEVKA